MAPPLHFLACAATALLALLAACAPTPSPPSVRLDHAGTGTPAMSAGSAHLLSWRVLPGAPRIRGKQDDVHFISPTLGWSVNGEGNVFRTSDGGETWERMLHQPGTFFRAIAFVDSLTGFAANIGTDYFPNVTDTVPLYRTRDGGVTWSPVSEIHGPFPKGICNLAIAPDGRTLWAAGRVGGPSFLLVSHDRGETWESQELTDRIAMLIDVHFTSAASGVIVGGSSRDVRASHSVVLATADGGRSWEEVFRSPEPMELAWKIDFPTARTGYVSVLAYDSTSTFLKTVDGGRTWREHPLVNGPYQAKGIGFVDEQVGWVGGERPGMPGYRTADGGATWTPDGSLEPLVNRFRFVRGADGRIEAAYAIGMTIQKLEVAP
jgi:photosystem II stability/assembly factor-like uncharacterized protein